MRNKFLMLIFILSSLASFGQAGTTVTTVFEDFGTFVMDFSNSGLSGGTLYNTYQEPSGFQFTMYFNVTQWEIRVGGPGGSVWYINPSTQAPNPPSSSTAAGWVNQDPFNYPPLLSVVHSGALPVELSRFEGNTKGTFNELTWQTASEINNKGFEIERSKDGVRFEKIGFVEGNGTSRTIQNYTFDDKKPFNGLSYYRLKQVDNNGDFEYSKIITVTQKGKIEASVFPNPSNGFVTVSGIEEMEKESFILANAMGQTLTTTVDYNGQLDMTFLPTGVYYLRVLSTQQVIKLIRE
jgi:hypothetical protein